VCACVDHLYHLAKLLPEAACYSDCVKVTHVPAEREGRHLEIVRDGERALAYLSSPQVTAAA